MKRNSIFWIIYSSLLLIAAIPTVISNLWTILFYGQENYLLKNSLLTFFVIVIAATLAALILSRNIIFPLQTLTSKMKEVIKGKLDVKVAVESKTEIGEVARSFNEMVGKLKEQQERERAVSQMKSEFLTVAAHQLRTPLSAVKWGMKMLISGDFGKLAKEQEEFLVKSYQTNEKMIQIINDLLDVVKIEEGKFGYVFSYADLSSIIEEAIAEQQLLAEKKNVRISFKKPENAVPKIKMDGQKIKLVISNLLENSINYTMPDGFAKVSIKQENADFIEVRVSDNGIGIAKEQMSRIFDKFFRGSNALKVQTEGSGLGLYIARNIVKRHGGEIWVESLEGKGTDVYFTLPIKESMIPPQEEVFKEFISGF